MERKAFALDLKAGDSGAVEGYGSVFGTQDEGGDVVAQGAFAASLAKRMPRMLWQHRSDVPVGVWDEVREDATGLFVKGRLAPTEKGRECGELLRMGALSGLSIGYRTLADEIDGNRRILKTLDLFEVSFVTFPMNEAAGVTAIKCDSERAFEAMLREQGFSQNEAKVIVSRGWKGLADFRRDGGKGNPEPDQRDAEAFKAELQRFIERIGQ